MKESNLKEIQANFCKALPDAYEKIRVAYLLDLHGKYDQLREEICHCITFGLFQASITLTNHLLELVLKDSLIFDDSKLYKLSSLKESEKNYLEAIEKFDGMVLYETIELAHASNIITDSELAQLHIYRNSFRNAYGHAQKSKIFGDETIPLALGSLTGSKETEIAAPKVSSMIFLHGEIQSRKASIDAIPYFLYVDKILIREEIKRAPEIVNHPELHQRHFNFQ
jgi:hypothetical protein